MAMLEVNNLKTHFRTQDGVVKAVDGVSFSLEAGETLGIVGESGSGKSVTALSIMQLNPKPPAEYPEGEILFEDQNLLETSDKRMQEIRGNDIAMIFQDPMTSLNPVFTVGNQIREAIRIHQNLSKSEAQEKTVQVLKDVGIANPERRVKEYPHQFSGRHAPAGHDRHGPLLQPQSPDSGRADHRPRRDDPGPDPGAHGRVCRRSTARPSS